MPEYRVRWEIDIEAESYQEAAEAALAIQRIPASIATVFDVRADGESTPMRVDLEPPVHVQPLAPADDDDLWWQNGAELHRKSRAARAPAKEGV